MALQPKAFGGATGLYHNFWGALYTLICVIYLASVLPMMIQILSRDGFLLLNTLMPNSLLRNYQVKARFCLCQVYQSKSSALFLKAHPHFRTAPLPILLYRISDWLLLLFGGLDEQPRFLHTNLSTLTT